MIRTLFLAPRNGLHIKTAVQIGEAEIAARQNPRGHCVRFELFLCAQTLACPLWGGSMTRILKRTPNRLREISKILSDS